MNITPDRITIIGKRTGLNEMSWVKIIVKKKMCKIK
jgi:hypothetical protein